MRELPRQKLCEIFAAYGRSLCYDPRRCEALLRDLCHGHGREVFVLTGAHRAGLPADLLAGASAPPEVLLSRHTRRLQDNLAFTEEAARWAVGAWALALGILTDVDAGPPLPADAPNDRYDRSVEESRPADGGPGHAPRAAGERCGEAAEHPGLFGTGGVGELPVLTLVVARTGPGHYRSLGDAVRNALPGSRILVRPGLYHERVVIDRPVEIIGTGSRADTVIRSDDGSCVEMRADYALIRGIALRFRSGGGAPAHAVDIAEGRLVLEECDIASDALACVAIHGRHADPILRRCRIADGGQQGVIIAEGAEGLLERCEIAGNGWEGLEIREGARPAVRECRIVANQGAGVSVWKGGRGLMEACDIGENAYAGVEIRSAGDPVLRRCRIHRNGREAVRADKDASGRVEGCDLQDNVRGAWRAPLQWRLLHARGNRE